MKISCHSDEFQYFIGRRHWLDALTPPLENHIAQLVQVAKKILENNPEPEENKGISPSPGDEKTVRNIPVTPRRSQQLMYLGGGVIAVAIIMIIAFSGISFPPAAHSSIPPSSNPDGASSNSTSASPTSSISLSSTTRIQSHHKHLPFHL